MSISKPWAREKNGRRFLLRGGMNTVKAVDTLPEGEYAYLQNIRGYLQDRIIGRATEGAAIISVPTGQFSKFPVLTGSNTGGAAWINPIQVTFLGQYTQATVGSGMSSGAMTIAAGTNLIPPTATIIGVLVEFVAYATNGLVTNSVDLNLTLGPGSTLHQLTSLPTSPGAFSMGGVGDNWGLPLTPTLVNAGLTVYMSFLNNTVASQTCYVSSMTMTIYYTLINATPNSLRRLNDTTPLGPVNGYSLVFGTEGGAAYVNATQVASGLSGNPLSLVPFRPNTSVQPWMYMGDSDLTVTLTQSGFNCAGMIKARSDGLTYKTGIAEPQSAPTVSTTNTTTTGSFSLSATTPPWTNFSGANPSYNYSQTTQPGTGGVGGIVLIATPVYGSTVQLTVTGTATVNGASHSAGDAGPTSATTPGNFITSPSIVVGAFTDGSGNVVALPAIGPVNIGSSVTLTVPAGAVQLQVGINSTNSALASNTGSFTVNWSVTVSAIATKISTIGNVTAYYWGDSPHSGPVATYIWKNPNDVGSGIARSIGTAAGSSTNNSWQMNSSPQDGTVPVQWDTLDSSGSVVGEIVLFSPALESEGYQDFNVAVTGSIFVPAAGTYSFTLVNKDQVMFGVGGGATIAGGYVTGSRGQTMSVVSGLPLVYVSAVNGAGGAVTQNLSITFPGQGNYSLELDWDYWFHTGRSLILTVNGAAIPPLPQAVRTNASYAAKYRSSLTGAVSNPGPASTPQVTPVLDNTVSCPFSPDPQVDKVDYYRQDSGLANYTYVATGPNTNPPTPISDTLSDLAVSANPIMQTDDFEPFPSIDLPKSGRVNVSGGVISWVSGDQFNVRWLPGTVILIGSPTQLAYTFISRPTSTTTVTIPEVPDGTNLAYNIAEPILAAQPLPSLWGPTDNTAYMFACYDPLRPGTLYYTKGNNPDSAPDTNQIEVTSPSEPLMNGYIIGGIGQVFSTERAWWIYPTFTTALATVSGVSGQAFNLIESVTERGLFIRTCICTEAGKNGFFRAKDGIYISPSGSGSKSITDATIYNLFPHETNSGWTTPEPVIIGPYTVYPPDDTKPSEQKLSFAYGYLYYDYQDTGGNYRTLVYDVAAKGWSVDVYGAAVSVHSPVEGQANGTYVGCSDGTIRALIGGSGEGATSVIATGSVNESDDRAFKRLGDVYIKALINAPDPVTAALYADRYQQTLAGFSPTSLTGTGLVEAYILDITSGKGTELIDVALGLSWATQSENEIELWQPTFTPLPAFVQDQPTDWGDLGSPGLNFVQGLVLEADTFNAPKAIAVLDENGIQHIPDQSPITLNGQQKIALTFTPPFTSHIGRIVSTDGVPWRRGPDDGWAMQWVSQPYPESTVEWQTEMISFGLKGWLHIPMVNIPANPSATITLTLVFDQWPTQTVSILNTGAQLIKQKVIIHANKFKMVSFRLNSRAAFNLFEKDVEVWVGEWGRSGPYRILKPFGGNSSAGALV